jgi:ketosteroid isomerase-like protein
MNQQQMEQEVARLADAWATAELQSDTAFLEKILADNFVGVGPLGFLLTKQEWLAWLQSGDLKHDALALDEVKVRVYNDAALVICRLVQDATYRGNPIMAQLRTTLVFVQHQGQWQLAGLHEGNIDQPPPFVRS